ncbi:hypothetical protein FA15DRAFT_172573 [Coprinopsis marcescibilis]|uniref:Uncharacterized protein n=1 Tax=Coprinopsis marcescibilis TaxID=230819 RepID=A0A5C3KI15_COPMA|nr:hypothetical protein FA15DRAFT_172573 [Coprinopsis marcescibilis]
MHRVFLPLQRSCFGLLLCSLVADLTLLVLDTLLSWSPHHSASRPGKAFPERHCPKTQPSIPILDGSTSLRVAPQFHFYFDRYHPSTDTVARVPSNQ